MKPKKGQTQPHYYQRVDATSQYRIPSIAQDVEQYVQGRGGKGYITLKTYRRITDVLGIAYKGKCKSRLNPPSSSRLMLEQRNSETEKNSKNLIFGFDTYIRFIPSVPLKILMYRYDFFTIS